MAQIKNIICAIANDSVREAAKRHNVSEAVMLNIYNLYKTQRNNIDVEPTAAEVSNILNNRRRELAEMEYAIPRYNVSNETVNIDNFKDGFLSTARLEDNGTITLQKFAKDVTIDDIKEALLQNKELSSVEGFDKLLNVLENKKDYYTVALWTEYDLNSNSPEYGIKNALINALRKLERYKKLTQQNTELPYEEVDKFSDDRLASTNKEGRIRIKKNITVDEFFEYLQGKEGNETSQQKKAVLKNMEEKYGITLDFLKTHLNNSETIKQFIYLHELNHKMNLSEDMKNYNRDNMMAQNNIDIETRANMYALEKMGLWNRQNNNADAVINEAGEQENIPFRTEPVANNTEREEDNPPKEGTPEYNPNAIQVDRESPRARLGRVMSPIQVINREQMLARDFSDVLDRIIDEMIEDLQSRIENETDNITKLTLSQQLQDLRDPQRSRRNVINAIGIDAILDEMKQDYETWINMTDEEISDVTEIDPAYMRSEYSKVLEFFDVLFDEAAVIIEQNEEIRITNEIAERTDTEEDVEDEITGDNDNRATGNEGYTFKVRFVDAHESSRAETRKFLSQFVREDSEGNQILDDLGRPSYYSEEYLHSTLLNIISNEVNTPDDFCLKNEDGTYSFPVLERHLDSYPWMKYIIGMLEENPQMVSIFYNDFRKEFISYYMHRGNMIFPLNQPIAYESTMSNLVSNYETGNIQDDNSIFNVNTRIDKKRVREINAETGQLFKDAQRAEDEEEMHSVAERTVSILKQMGFSSTNIDTGIFENFDTKEKRTIVLQVIQAISQILTETENLTEGQHYIDASRNWFSDIARLIGKATELDAKSTFRQSGKDYSSYAAPNYIERMLKAFHQSEEKRREYMEREFGRFDWFRHNGKWQNEILRQIAEDGEAAIDNLQVRNIFNLDGADYADWDSSAIIKAFIREFYATPNSKGINYSWIPFPIFSDTQMATFMKVRRFENIAEMVPLFRRLVLQEYRRMGLVSERRKKGIPAISNFDKRGTEFCFLPELNTMTKFYRGKMSTLVQILNDLLSREEYNEANKWIDSFVKDLMDNKVREFRIRHREDLQDKDLKRFVTEQFEGTGVTDEQLLDLESTIAQEYVWNSMFYTSQIIQLMTTDLAFYGSYEDFTKRFKEVYAAGTKLNTNSRYGRKYEHTVYVKDSTVTSPTFIPVMKLFERAYKEGRISKMDYDSIRNKFKNINATDGQAYRSLDSYRAVLDMLGRWNEDMENAFERMEKGEWDMSDFNIVWSTIKPFVFGNLAKPDGLGGWIRSPHQNKNSEFLLLAILQTLGTVMNNSPQLRGIARFMKEHQIDVVQFESSVKTGGTGIIDINVSPSVINEIKEKKGIVVNGKFYDLNTSKENITDAFEDVKNQLDNKLEKGEITQEEYNDVITALRPDEAEVFNTLVTSTRSKLHDSDVIDEDGYNMNTVHTISYDDYMIAQPSTEHLLDAEVVFGSQYRNLIVADLPEDIEVTVEGETIKGRDNVRNLYMSLLIENLLDSYAEVDECFSSIEKLQQRLISIVKGNPRYGRDMLDALQIVEVNGRKTFNIPFSDRVMSTKFQQIFTSMFKNGVTKQHTNGAACVITSDFGYTEELQIERNEDGSIKAVQCYLPVYSKKLYEPFLKEIKGRNGRILGYEMDYDKLVKADPSLLEGVGYRIPTELKYSMVPFKIVGFLPQQNGSSIMLPAELTTITDWDFDIDKLFMFLPSFEYGDTYNLKQAWDDFYSDVSNADVVENIEKNLAEGARVKGMTEEEFYELIRENGFRKYHLSDNQLAQRRFSEWFKDKKDRYKTGTKFERIKYDVTKGPEGNTRKQRDNALLQIGQSILKNNKVAEESQSPGGTDKVKRVSRIADIINNPDYVNLFAQEFNIKSFDELINTLYSISFEDVNRFIKKYRLADNPLTPDTYIKYHNQNMAGAVLIGIYANNNSMHAKLQGHDISIKDDYVFNIDGKTIKSLSDVFTTEKQGGKEVQTRISRNIAPFIPSATDNAKDPILASLMQNRNTAAIMNFMMRAGLSIQQAGLLFSNPIVRNTIQYTGNVKALNAFITNAMNEVKSLTGNENENFPRTMSVDTRDLLRTSVLYNNKQWYDAMSDGKKANIIKKLIDYANTFQHIANLANVLNNTVTVYRADSPNGAIKKSLALAKSQILQAKALERDSATEGYPFEGITELLATDTLDKNMSIDKMRDKLKNSNIPLLQAFYSLGIELGFSRISEYFMYSTDYLDSLVNKMVHETGNMSGKTIEAFYRAAFLFGLSDTSLFGNNNNMSMEQQKAWYLNEFPKKFLEIKRNNPDIAALSFIQKLSVIGDSGFNASNGYGEGLVMKSSTRNSPYLRELLMNSADNLLYLDNPVAQQLAQDLFRYAFYKEGLDFVPNGFSLNFSSLYRRAFPEYINTLRSLEEGQFDTRWERLLDQFYANNPGLVYNMNVSQEALSPGGNTLTLKRESVINPRTFQDPYMYVYAQSNNVENLYKLVPSAPNEEFVTYMRMETTSANLYDMNKDSNDMITDYNKALEKYGKEEKRQVNRQTNSQSIEDFMNEADDSYFDMIADYEAEASEYDNNAKVDNNEVPVTPPIDKYEAEKTLEENGIKPCIDNMEGEIIRTL